MHDAISTDDAFNLAQINIQKFASRPDALRLMVSTYDANDGMLRDSHLGPGRKVATFANMLGPGAPFPLAPAVDLMLSKGQHAMQRPVEIEFAGMVNAAGSPQAGHIYWLQIRPIIDRKEDVDPSLLDLTDNELLLRSNTALGHGTTDTVQTVVYIRPERFSQMHNPETAREIAEINRRFVETGEGYILIGPGRWGSSDFALGVPVRWPDISAARLIVETTLANYRVEPSQGTHFFQNLTSAGVGYFTVNPFATAARAGRRADYFNPAVLDAMPAEYESDAVRVVRFPAPLLIGINGKKGIGVVRLPDSR